MAESLSVPTSAEVRSPQISRRTRRMLRSALWSGGLVVGLVALLFLTTGGEPSTLASEWSQLFPAP